VEKLGGTIARHHQGMRPWHYGPCKYFSDTIAYLQASVNCMEALFNQAMSKIGRKTGRPFEKVQKYHKLKKTNNYLVTAQLINEYRQPWTLNHPTFSFQHRFNSAGSANSVENLVFG